MEKIKDLTETAPCSKTPQVPSAINDCRTLSDEELVDEPEEVVVTNPLQATEESVGLEDVSFLEPDITEGSDLNFPLFQTDMLIEEVIEVATQMNQ